MQRVGQDGPLLLQDFHLVDLLSHFDRERIPERVVHAKGSGAHGVFKCTKSLEDICFADAFSTEGLECPVTVRFSVSWIEFIDGDRKQGVLLKIIQCQLDCRWRVWICRYCQGSAWVCHQDEDTRGKYGLGL